MNTDGWYEPWANIRWDPTLTHDVRRQVIRTYAKQFPTFRTFVETGTADGQTVIDVRDLFERAFTIEVGEDIYKKWSPRVIAAGGTPILGDSLVVLPRLLAEINASCVFWLDGHFCGGARGQRDTPVAEELQTIFATNIPHVILIDDARLFGNDKEYPTVDWVRNLATTQDVRYSFAYNDDIMRITPR